MSDEPVILEMFGDPDAAQCIDGVCAVPGTAGDERAGPDASPQFEMEASPRTT